MPHFVRTMLHGKPNFSIDWNFKPKSQLSQKLGTVAAEDVVKISDAEAAQGINKLRDLYFPDPGEVLHGHA